MEPEEARALQPHPYCLWFPLLSVSAYEELSNSVKFDGLLEPIILLDGQILDGRHRLKACLEGDTPPRFHNFDEVAAGLSPINWVLARNLYRRHLTDDQALAIVTTANGERLLARGRRAKNGRRKTWRSRQEEKLGRSGSSFQRTIGEMHASSAVGQLAADAKSTLHTATSACRSEGRAESAGSGSEGRDEAEGRARQGDGGPSNRQAEANNGASPAKKMTKATANDDFFNQLAAAISWQFAACATPKERRDLCGLITGLVHGR